MSRPKSSHEATRCSFSIEQCDVKDRAALKSFRAKRDEWLEWLYGDEHHAIDDQITTMVWSDAVFRLVNESRRHASEAQGRFACLNGDIAELIDRGYVHEQLIALRRLLEPASKRPEKQIISLRRLIDDIKVNQHLLTREIFVCYDGLPYDHAKVEAEEFANWDGTLRWGHTTGPKAWTTAQREHDAFDRWSRIDPDKRQRDDPIGPRVFDLVEQFLAGAPFKKVRRILNKMIAHAADPHSRGREPMPGATLSEIWACHKAIIQATEIAGTILVRAHGPGGVPYPQYDVVEGWDLPFAPASSLEVIREGWDATNEERREWGNVAHEALNAIPIAAGEK